MASTEVYRTQALAERSAQPRLLDRFPRHTFPIHPDTPGYTDLQSLLKCLDHRGIVLVLDTVCSQAMQLLHVTRMIVSIESDM